MQLMTPDNPHYAPSRDGLVREIHAFLNETGMKPTPFGLLAARDDKLLWRIEHARHGISLDKADRIRAFMATFRIALANGTPRDQAIAEAKRVVDGMLTHATAGDAEQEAQTGRARRRSVRNAASGRPRAAKS